MSPRILALESTELFVGDEEDCHQVVRVSLADLPLPSDGEISVEIEGHRISGRVSVGGSQTTVEVPVSTVAAIGTEIAVRAILRIADREMDRLEGTVRVAEPGWSLFMVSHFHYDPVWWNTQGAYTSGWDFLSEEETSRPLFETNAFALVRAHIDMALRDPDYRFVLAEVDYLKPFWDTCPEYRRPFRRLLAEGRLEIMGGTYNEPNTNLTGSETTIRNIVYGVGYQRDVLGGDPQTGWQLDVFGHDPQFPGLLAAAGLTSSSWARGPFHQWGPAPWIQHNSGSGTSLVKGGDPSVMQFPAEFNWISPSGGGVLTHYMPNHYSAGWLMDSSASLAEAEEAVYELFLSAKQVASTRNTLLPVGSDYTPPNLWVTEIHRDWNDRYCWPKFVCAIPRDFFSAVRAELEAEGRLPTPQSRDMNPVYTGKDVSFIDTKQAQRAAEVAVGEAERFATLVCLLEDGIYPEEALDKVWRQLAYGAHHDAITGSESDQVYIDLLAGWREAYDLALEVRDRAIDVLLARIAPGGQGSAVTVVNSLSFVRCGIVEAEVRLAAPSAGVRVVDDGGDPVPFVVIDASEGTATEAPATDWRVSFRADDVPGLGWRTWYVVAEDQPAQRAQWRTIDGGNPSIENEFLRLRIDPARGGGITSLVTLGNGREVIAPGEVGNELRVYEEYPTHPEFGEGPWHLLPTGPQIGSAATPARSVTVERSPLGQRLVVSSEVGEVAYQQTITLWSGIDQVDLSTRVVDFTGADRLVRIRIPVHVQGALPVSDVAAAAIGRGFAFPDADAAVHPWTLDNPANTWFALSSTLRVDITDPVTDTPRRRAIGVVEIVQTGVENPVQESVVALVAALARRGVTATTSSAGGTRYGWLEVDSNLPDARILVGGPEVNPVTADLLDQVDPAYAGEMKRLVDESGCARVWVPAARSLAEVWQPSADLRDLRALPALILAGRDTSSLAAALGEVVAELGRTGRLAATTPLPDEVTESEDLDDTTVGLVTYGTPGFAVDPTGALYVSVLRSSTGWPSGIWIDPPKRRAPDGSAFQLQHWTHEFHYGLVVGDGDWRHVGLANRGLSWSAPLLARRLAHHQPGGGGGDLPSTHALVSVEPADSVILQAFKPVGNPSATGRHATVDPADGVTLRLTETRGDAVVARVGGVVGWDRAQRANLLEETTNSPPLVVDHGVIEVPLDGAEVATVRAVSTVPPRRSGRAAIRLGPDREPVQPSYARYWLHNRGPAPMGFLPVAVAVEPQSVVLRGPHVDVRISVASQLTDDRGEGMLSVEGPPGWSAEPAHRVFSLAPGDYTDFRARITRAPDAPAGLYFVAVRIETTAGAVEDVISVVVPGPAADAVTPGSPGITPLPQHLKVLGTETGQGRDLGVDVELTVGSEGPGGADPSDGLLVVHPGGGGRLVVTVNNRTASPVHGELQLVSPWGTWDMVRPASRAVEVPAQRRVEVVTEVACPAGTAPGHWWVMAKWMWFGRVQYTTPVVLRVDRPSR